MLMRIIDFLISPIGITLLVFAFSAGARGVSAMKEQRAKGRAMQMRRQMQRDAMRTGRTIVETDSDDEDRSDEWELRQQQRRDRIEALRQKRADQLNKIRQQRASGSTQTPSIGGAPSPTNQSSGRSVQAPSTPNRFGRSAAGSPGSTANPAPTQISRKAQGQQAPSPTQRRTPRQRPATPQTQQQAPAHTPPPRPPGAPAPRRRPTQPKATPRTPSVPPPAPLDRQQIGSGSKSNAQSEASSLKFGSKQALRHAIIMREVLGPPVALRDPAADMLG